MHQPLTTENFAAERSAAAARISVIDGLRRAGIPTATGELLVDEWLASTVMLLDFRAAPDFWQLAYEFAVDEYRRRAHRAA
jgi:hypothetical protein